MKGAIYQEEITIVNIHALNESAPNFIKYILLNLKTQMNPYTVVMGDFNTLLSPIDRLARQKNQQRTSRIE
jgi:hypothetical protein